MEVEGGKENKKYVLLYECIGTANLLYAINLSQAQGLTPFAVGLTIFSNICIFGEVSGGHFNPAVTLGVLIAEGTENLGSNIGFAIQIIMAQIVGACIGCLSVYLATYTEIVHHKHEILPKIAILAPNGKFRYEETEKNDLLHGGL